MKSKKISYELVESYPNSPEIGTIHWYENLTSSKEWFGLEFYNKHDKYWKMVEYIETVDKREIKEPLFITEDGVGVFRMLHPDLWRVKLSDFTIGVDYKNSLRNPDTIRYKYFSTEEKAIKYTELHKPQYSMNDIKSALKHHLGIVEYFKFWVNEIKNK